MLRVPRALERLLGAEALDLLSRLANAKLEVEAESDETSASDASAAIKAVRIEAAPGVLRERNRKELERLDVEVERLEKKLANEQFTSKASPDVVAKERAKLAGYESERARVRAQLTALDAGERG
jgi:valyl-tRNA synthetase